LWKKTDLLDEATDEAFDLAVYLISDRERRKN